jgi:hypothetical protein
VPGTAYGLIPDYGTGTMAFSCEGFHSLSRLGEGEGITVEATDLERHNPSGLFALTHRLPIPVFHMKDFYAGIVGIKPKGRGVGVEPQTGGAL